MNAFDGGHPDWIRQGSGLRRLIERPGACPTWVVLVLRLLFSADRH